MKGFIHLGDNSSSVLLNNLIQTLGVEGYALYYALCEIAFGCVNIDPESEFFTVFPSVLSLKTGMTRRKTLSLLKKSNPFLENQAPIPENEGRVLRSQKSSSLFFVFRVSELPEIIELSKTINRTKSIQSIQSIQSIKSNQIDMKKETAGPRARHPVVVPLTQSVEREDMYGIFSKDDVDANYVAARQYFDKTPMRKSFAAFLEGQIARSKHYKNENKTEWEEAHDVVTELYKEMDDLDD